jgi:hypothetical protein
MYKGKKTGSKSGVFARYNEKDYITEERSRKQALIGMNVNEGRRRSHFPDQPTRPEHFW